MPAFWVGTMLLFLLAYKLPIFPAGGLQPGFVGHLKTLFLPAATLGVLYTAVLVRSLRASLLEVLDSEFVLAARARSVRRQARLEWTEWKTLCRFKIILKNKADLVGTFVPMTDALETVAINQ